MTNELAREVRRLALPAILHSLLQTLVFVVDRIMLGRHGEASLAAMQIGGALEWSIWSVFSAFEVGTIARVGRHVGAGDRPNARRAALLSLGMAVAVGFVLALATPLVLDALPLVTKERVSAEAISEARGYLGVTIAASPLVFIAATSFAVLQAGGDTRTPLAIGVVANIVHVALNWALILGAFGLPAMGARGAGISTAVTFAIEAVLATLALMNRSRAVSLRRDVESTTGSRSDSGSDSGSDSRSASTAVSGAGARADADAGAGVGVGAGARAEGGVAGGVGVGDADADADAVGGAGAVGVWETSSSARGEARALVLVGGPAFLERLLYHVGFISYALLITRLGDAAMAANQSLISVESICFLSADGFGVAAAALVAQKLGAKKPDEARRAAWIAARYAVITLTVFGLGSLALRDVILPLFSDDRAVIGIGRSAMPVLAAAQPFMATSLVLAQSLRGAGRTREALGVSLIGAVFVRLTATWLFAMTLGLGLVGVWMGSTTDWLVRASVLALMFRRRRSRESKQAL